MEFWRTPRSDSGGPAGDGNRILHQVFYPHFLKKMKMSLPTSAAKSLFHVFYLGYPDKLDNIVNQTTLGRGHFSFRGINYLKIWWTCLGNVPPAGDPHGITNFPRHVQWTCLGKIKRLMGPRNHEIFFPDMFIEHVWENHLHCDFGGPKVPSLFFILLIKSRAVYFVFYCISSMPIFPDC